MLSLLHIGGNFAGLSLHPYFFAKSGKSHQLPFFRFNAHARLTDPQFFFSLM
jgi:hypothetical protein